MLSLVDISGRRTAACALRNSLYLLPAGCLATYLGVATVAFSTEAAIMTGANRHTDVLLAGACHAAAVCTLQKLNALGKQTDSEGGGQTWHFNVHVIVHAGGFAVTAVAWYQSRTNAAARLLFRTSLLYLPLFMAALLFHRIPNTEENRQRVANRLSALTGWSLADTDSSWVLVDRPPVSAFSAGPQKSSYHSITLAPFPFLPCPAAIAVAAERPADRTHASQDD